MTNNSTVDMASLDAERIAALQREIARLEESRFGLVTESLHVLVNVRQYLDAARSEEKHAGTWSEWDEQMWQSAVELTRRMDEAVNELIRAARTPDPSPQLRAGVHLNTRDEHGQIREPSVELIDAVNQTADLLRTPDLAREEQTDG